VSSSDEPLPEILTDLMRRLPYGSHAHSVLAVRQVAGRAARLVDLPDSLDPRLAAALRSRGVSQLYAHQRASWDAVLEGRDLVVVTPTASGKTLCFNLPVLDAALRDPKAGALYFYPTKALANDQFAALRELTGAIPGGPTVGIYHGDLTEPERTAIMADPPNVLLATPDIVHFNHLPKHVEWRRWWSTLRFVVVDEAHAYRGVFGSHVGHLLRRVRRVAAIYESRPQFIAASATIGNPIEHIANLIGREPVLVDQDGSPQAARDVVVWEPLVYDNTGTPVAFESSERETARLLIASMLAGYSTIVFARSRRWVERIARRATKQLRNGGHHVLADSLVPYRSGYSRERRQEIERGLKDGHIKGVVATNALELGVDIGSLDVAILSTYPGSTMSFRQQAGRAGRRGKPALVLMVASQNPLDRYIAEHPDVLTSSDAEMAATDIANPRIAFGELGLAARESRLTTDDGAVYGESFAVLVDAMQRAGKLTALRSSWEPVGRGPRPIDVPLRTIDGRAYALLVDGRHLGDLDARVVPREAHPGAIYLHDGAAYRVRGTDRESRTIALEPSDEGVYTEPRGEQYIDILSVRASRTRSSLVVRLVDLKVSSTVSAYLEIDEDSGRPRGQPFDIDPVRSNLATVGLAFSAREAGDPAALHAVEHLVRGLAPLTILCDRADLDGHTQIDEYPPTAYVYDRYEGGVGLAERLYESLDRVLEAACDRVDTCECETGCPRCIQSAACLRRNEVLYKAGAAMLLRSV
jgi:DEAD/DEAH box helicase domain-containing protein